MTETLAPPITDLAQRNLELLEQTGEYGQAMKEVYQTAMDLDPRLQDVEFVAAAKETPSPAMARPAWHSETGKHQVLINTHNIDGVMSKIISFVDSVPGARELFAAQIDIQPEELTPAMLLMHVVGHELGHIRDYMDYEDDPEAFDAQRETEWSALPVKNFPASKLAQQGYYGSQQTKDLWRRTAYQKGFGSFEELLQAQHTAYRNMRTERIADDFAVEILDRRRDLVDQFASTPSLEQA